MIIDSSALLAIALKEPEARRIVTAIASAESRKVSTINWLEAMMVLESRLGPQAADNLELILSALAVQPLPFDGKQMVEAQTAWRRFGKGRHPAALNLADCCAYAASIVAGEPLLFKGSDFAQTDVKPAQW